MSAIEVGGATPAPEDQHHQVTLEAVPEAVQYDHTKDQESTDEQATEQHASETNQQLHSQLDQRLFDPEAATNEPSLPAIHSLSKKRKRAASPPWQFPTAEQTTIKTSDGRRSSARVNVSVSNTPGLSESESQGHRTSRAASSRLSSPPWKEFRADGPTSLHVDGVRKSGRVNKELTQPKRISPRSRKQTDKLTQSGYAFKDKPGMQHATGAKEQTRGRKRTSSKTNGQTIEELSAQIAELQSAQKDHEGKAKHRRNTSGEGEIEVAMFRRSPDGRKTSRPHGKPDTSRPTPRLKLRLNSTRHVVGPPHPHAVFPPQIHPPNLSLWQLIEDFELKEMQQPYSENERGPPSREEFERRATKTAEQEAVMRQKLVEAGKPGGILSEEKCSIYQDARPQQEPPKQYAHRDHLLSHAMWFRQLQIREDAKHRQTAKKLAHDALDEWKKRRGPTAEDLQAEADKMFKTIFKQVMVDIKAKWDLVTQHVEDGRRARYEAEQETRRQERLKKQLAWSENMVARQRGEVDSDNESDEPGSSSEGNEKSDDDSDENMSDDSSEDDLSDRGDAGMDDDALQAYLAQRAAEPPDRKSTLAELLDGSSVAETDNDEDMPEASEDAEALPYIENDTTAPSDAGAPPLSQNNDITQDDVDQPTSREQAVPLSPKSADDLSSDESIDMDSEDYDSDEDMSESDVDGSEAGESASSEELAPRSGLLGFFSKSDLRAQGLPTPVTSAEGDHVDERDDTGMEVVEQVVAEDIITPANDDTKQLNEPPDTMIMAKTHLSGVQALSRPDTPASQARSELSTKNLVPQPTLLRGTLRSYQHAGLDWLASLYRNETNGILADEMGLGKTIQTISLFAHIAEQHNVWDPHLVIVPTSVLLNWVTEIQKFLPGFRVLGYYGSTEDRQAKRRGWVNDPHHEIKDKRGYNVIVTSYNIALKDINAIRNVQWHYMVLDEAHNIRNFNSQRFQNLIKLKTRARLLLTGTPLQNSLTELWSLLTFLTAGRDDNDEAAHGGLEEFLARWKEPVNEIFERGVQTLSDEAAKVVGQLHTSLRPFMLRRLKADVEKDLPRKTEHVVVCKLSKRQRQLYQDYMGLSDTRAKLKQGNAVSAGKVLLSLRRVCNHPDLFDPRPIQTSYALEKSPIEPYSAKEQVVRRLLGGRQLIPHKLNMAVLETERRYRKARGKQLSAVSGLRRQAEACERGITDTPEDMNSIAGCQALLRLQRRKHYLQQLKDSISYTENYFATRPLYGSDLRELLTVRSTRTSFGCNVLGRLEINTLDSTSDTGVQASSEAKYDKLAAASGLVQQSIKTADQRAEVLHDTIVRFAFCTPEVTAPVLNFAINDRAQKVIRASAAYPDVWDAAQEARARTSIVFPDKRLLEYDAGKLQRLKVLLRELQAKKSRSLIFTQMSGTLDILERFLGLMNLRYLRLDGSTPVERRALYSAEFNNPNSKYQCMILSSRAGGVGLNLTGASSVIFYDLDWNPQMDKQCMDRAHRIGQVRDVEVYKMVSEKTVEENILRRANQKSLLDQTIIQEGHFTTDYNRDREEKPQPDDDVAAAIDRLLSGGDKALTKTIESVEDKEDVQAAQQARKEEMQDEEDFAERPTKGSSVQPAPVLPDGVEQSDIDMNGHIDSYMIKYIEEALRYVPYVPPVVVTRDPSHRKKRRR